MNRPAWKRPSPSLVLSMITLFVALTSTAGALPGKGTVERGDIAKGAVTKRALARGAVKSRAIAQRAVTSKKLANDAVVERTDADLASGAVTGRTIRPRSVDGFALAGTFSPVAGIADAEPVGDGGDFAWTSSPLASATCSAGSKLLNGGIRIQDSSTHRAFLQSTFPSNSNTSTWVGQISTDSGGASPALLYALCLR